VAYGKLHKMRLSHRMNRLAVAYSLNMSDRTYASYDSILCIAKVYLEFILAKSGLGFSSLFIYLACSYYC
jgi:hypothetical protein